MKRDIQLIWDFDDTIVMTHKEYLYTNERAARSISQGLYGHEDNYKEICIYQRNLDLEMVQIYGFSSERYRLSWFETYSHLAKIQGIYVSPIVINELENLIQDLYIRKYTNISDSLSVLAELKESNYPMIVLTAGDERIQRRKVLESGANAFMDSVYIFTKKTPESFRTVAENHPAQKYVMIGNSLKSDVYPALENNAWGFHVERETWEADNYNIDRSHPKYVNLSSLSEIPEQLEELNNHSFVITS